MARIRLEAILVGVGGADGKAREHLAKRSHDFFGIPKQSMSIRATLAPITLVSKQLSHYEFAWFQVGGTWAY